MSHDVITDLAAQLATEYAGSMWFSVALEPDILDDVARTLATMGYLVARDSDAATLTVRDRRIRPQAMPLGCA